MSRKGLFREPKDVLATLEASPDSAGGGGLGPPRQHMWSPACVKVLAGCELWGAKGPGGEEVSHQDANWG